jgi:hypothetical protein
MQYGVDSPSTDYVHLLFYILWSFLYSVSVPDYTILRAATLI